MEDITQAVVTKLCIGSKDIINNMIAYALRDILRTEKYITPKIGVSTP